MIHVKICRCYRRTVPSFSLWLWHSDAPFTIVKDNVIVFHNATIGNGVTVRVNAVVNFDVPDGPTVFGSKAKIILPEKNENPPCQ